MRRLLYNLTRCRDVFTRRNRAVTITFTVHICTLHMPYIISSLANVICWMNKVKLIRFSIAKPCVASYLLLPHVEHTGTIEKQGSNYRVSKCLESHFWKYFCILDHILTLHILKARFKFVSVSKVLFKVIEIMLISHLFLEDADHQWVPLTNVFFYISQNK